MLRIRNLQWSVVSKVSMFFCNFCDRTILFLQRNSLQFSRWTVPFVMAALAYIIFHPRRTQLPVKQESALDTASPKSIPAVVNSPKPSKTSRTKVSMQQGKDKAIGNIIPLTSLPPVLSTNGFFPLLMIRTKNLQNHRSFLLPSLLCF